MNTVVAPTANAQLSAGMSREEQRHRRDFHPWRGGGICALRRVRAAVVGLAFVASALAALGAPLVHAATVDVPCGQQVGQGGDDSNTTYQLQACSYPYLFIQGTNVVVEGNGAVIDLPPGAGATYVLGSVTLRDLRITSGTYGGLRMANGNVVLERVVISGNTNLTEEACCYGGGGIVSDPNGNVTLTLIDSIVSDNTARVGGGIWFKFTINTYPATLNLVRSTISGNRAVQVSGDSHSGVGGGLYALNGQSALPMTVQIENSTISGNHADLYGGGMILQGAISPSISDSTITDNSAGLQGGGIYDFSGDVSDPGVKVRRSIIAGNTPQSCGGSYADFKTDYGYNVWSADCVGLPGYSEVTSKVIASNGALLGPLADNGGPTLTHLPLSGSPALDVIPFGVSGCGTDPATDQRGVERPQLGLCDIGAVEVEDTEPPTASPTLSPSPNAAGWYKTAVTVTWHWADTGSDIDPADCTTSTMSSGEGALTLSATCDDLVGNHSSASVDVHVDTTAPDTQLNMTPPASTSSTSASFSFSGADSGSGVGAGERE